MSSRRFGDNRPSIKQLPTLVSRLGRRNRHFLTFFFRQDPKHLEAELAFLR